MAIVNRSLDATEKKVVVHASIGALATSITRAVVPLAWPAALKSVAVAAQGLSGAPGLAIQRRYFAGGETTAILATLAPADYGTSGIQVLDVVSDGATQAQQLGSGDVLEIVSSGANTALADLSLNFVLEKLQDVVSHNGIIG